MKKVLLLMSLICFTFIGLTSCGSEDDDTIDSSEYVDTTGTSSLDFNSGHAIITFTVSSSTNWTASTDADWCFIVGTAAGTAGQTRVSVQTKDNTTGVDRHANLILKTANTQKLIPINQSK